MDTVSLRLLAEDALRKGMFASAAFVFEHVTRCPDATIADLLAFARCFYLQHQPRRCLAALEQRGLLSAQNTQLLSEALLDDGVVAWSGDPLSPAPAAAPSSSSSSSSAATGGSLPAPHLMDLVAAFQLAAQCLFSLEQHEDCAALLEPFAPLDDADAADFDARHGAAAAGATFIHPTSPLMKRLRTLLTRGDGRGGDPASVNPLAGLYCTLGQVLPRLEMPATHRDPVNPHRCPHTQCYDLLDNRPRAVRALAAAVTLDCACTEVTWRRTEWGEGRVGLCVCVRGMAWRVVAWRGVARCPA